MLTSYPLPTAVSPPAAQKNPTPQPKAREVSSAVRYLPSRRSRLPLVGALVVSAAVHAGLIVGLSLHKKAAPKHVVDDTPMLALTIPQLKELEEEPPPSADAGEKVEVTVSVPMLADVPTIPRPNEFVQQIDLSSLLPPPDLSQAKVFTIPDHIRRGGKPEGMTNLFNLSDLDRVPQAVVQPSPIFPTALKREVDHATVRVEFIVDTEGRVLNVIATDSTHPGFEEAAIIGVSRWKFRPGMKSGRKVNTRMQVPIIFKLVTADY